MPFQTLPKWIQLGAFSLAFNAGMVNALALLNIWHQTVSHMTGNVSLLGIAIANGQYQHVIMDSVLLLALCSVLYIVVTS